MSTQGYRAPWWLPGPHLQTIYPTLALRPAPPPYRRETWDSPDGDFVDVDWVDGPDGAPLVVLFHGLEGSSRSPYAAALMQAVRARGWRGAVPHFRGCGGRPNRLPRAYHSGDADEIGWMLRRAQAASSGPLHAAGVSLGGNALLRWLARERRVDDPALAAAAAICPPLDLVAAGAALRRGFNRLYTWQFLRTLKPKTLAKCREHPGLFDPGRIASARDFDTFDDAYTAPAHGFAGVQDYWRRASSKPVLDRIRIPTLVISARNDPFLPARHLPPGDAVSPFVTLEQPASGGHVGFVSGPFPGHLRWLPERLLGFFAEAARPGGDAPSLG